MKLYNELLDYMYLYPGQTIQMLANRIEIDTVWMVTVFHVNYTLIILPYFF